MRLQVVFEVRGRDVLAARRDEDVLLAIRDRHEAVVVDLGNVACVQPALVVEHLARRGLVLQVAGEVHRPADQELAVRRELQLDAGQRRADRAEAEAVDAIRSCAARPFGKAVRLDDQDAQRVEELDDLLRERRAAREANADATAEPFLHLREDEPVCDAALQREQRRDALVALDVGARALADAQRPVDQPALDTGLLGELREHRAVDLLEHARHARENRGPHLRQRVGRAQRVGEEGERVPDIGPRQVHQAAEVVRERQVEEHQVVRSGQLLHVVDDRDHRVVVAVAKHAAFRRAGRPRRVDVREEIVLRDRRRRVADRVRVARRVLAPARAELVEVGEREHVLEAERVDLCPLLDSLGLEHVFTFADLDELRARGREHAARHPDAVRDASAAISEDDLFTYIYTSGTTGPPKGCMLRHRNYYSMVAVVDDMEQLTGPDDLMLLYLPLAHNFGRLMHLTGPYVGYTLAFLADPLRTADALTQVRPTILPSVPRVFEKVHGAVLAKFAEETGVKRRLIDWSLRVGERTSAYVQRDERVPPLLALQRRIADRLVFSKVKERLGGRIRVGLSGGAPLAKEIIEFFHALGVLIVEAYGLTEGTSGATANRVDRFRFGTVGTALPGVELKLAADGELLIRGPMNFAGYLKDEAATREVLDDEGWLYTGDIAQIDDDGFVTITDRKKDILVTAGGKNVAPANLENDLKTHLEISQALVVGDRRPFVAALVTLDPDVTAQLDEEAKQRRVQEIVDAVNRDRSRYEQIKKFAIVPRDFSAEEGEVTPTLKLKRRVVEQHFASAIEQLYAG